MPLPSCHRAARAALALLILGGLSSGCRPPDGRALQKLACEQAAASFDLQSLSQLDALRKALGLAPDVDPIGHCKALGAAMAPRPEAGESPQDR